MEAAEVQMLRSSLGETRMDRIRNENIRGAGHVRCFLSSAQRKTKEEIYGCRDRGHGVMMMIQRTEGDEEETPEGSS